MSGAPNLYSSRLSALARPRPFSSAPPLASTCRSPSACWPASRLRGGRTHKRSRHRSCPRQRQGTTSARLRLSRCLVLRRRRIRPRRQPLLRGLPFSRKKRSRCPLSEPVPRICPGSRAPGAARTDPAAREKRSLAESAAGGSRGASALRLSTPSRRGRNSLPERRSRRCALRGRSRKGRGSDGN